MPVSIKTGVLKYKNPITGEFISLNQVGDDLYSIIAPKYEDVTFPVNRGTLCIYDGGLYRATVDIPSSEEWDNTHWASTSVDDEMSDYATRIIDDNSNGLNKTWSANKISSVLEDINSFDVQIVQELPTQNIKTHTIYFVPKIPDTHDIYDEYIYVNNSWEMIGSTEVDISSKADKTELHITPVFSPGSNLGEYVCNLTFQEVYDAASNGKCDGCIVQVAPGMGMGLELMAVLPSMVSFVKTASMEGGFSTISLGYNSDGSISREKTQLDILRLFAKTYAFNTGLFPVKAGDYCINENKFYKANTDIAAFEAFNSSKWNEVTVGNELKTIASNSNAMIATIEEDNTSDNAYAIGDIFIYDNKLYKATSNIAVNDYILPNTNCIQTTISSALDGKEDKPDLIATYTITGTDTATCDKTIEEIGQAYSSGKTIEAVIVADRLRVNAQPMILNPRPDIYLCAVSATIGFEGIIHIVLMHSSGSETIPAIQFRPMLSANGVYSAENMKITQLANPTNSADAANKGYVDTALATKEDKADLTAIFTFTPDLSSQTPAFTVSCDKTQAELAQAYANNKKVEAFFSLYGQTALPARLLFSQSGQVTTIMADSTYSPEDAPVFIRVFGNTSSATWEVYFYQTIATDMLDRNSSFIAYSKRISYLGEPTDSGDATTKNYVDTALATKEDKPGLEVTFTVITNKTITAPGQEETDPYTVTCDTTDSDIVNAHDNGEKIRAVADIAGMRVELPLYMIETVPNVGSLIMFMGRSIDLYSIGSGLSNVGFSDVVLTKASFMGQQDWSISFKNPTDIQINGTSIVSNGVANIPIASSSTPGVAYIGNGLAMSSSGILSVQGANRNDATLKTGNSNNRSITPYNQDISVFYGLAKASGDSTQSESSNPVGTYTDGAKTAIQSMLDVPSTEEASNVVIVSDTEPTEEENKLWINNDDVAEYSVPTVAEMNTALSGKVGDVQVNGTSVVSSGVANIPIASLSALGVVRQHPTNTGATGILIMTSSGNEGVIATAKATDDRIKAGANTNMPIVPSNQHNATFYGLAKAAGDSTQSASSNPVGTYTDDAKAAIQSMIGIHNVEVVRLA